LFVLLFVKGLNATSLSSTLNGNWVTMEENLSAKKSFSFLSIYEKNVTCKWEPEARDPEETETLGKCVSGPSRDWDVETETTSLVNDVMNQQVRMYYGSGTVAHTWVRPNGITRTLRASRQSADATAYATLFGWPSWSSSWKCDVKLEIWLRQSMSTCVKDSRAKFHPIPIWNNETYAFFEECCPNKKNKMSDVYKSLF